MLRSTRWSSSTTHAARWLVCALRIHRAWGWWKATMRNSCFSHATT
jgi:hypothetical protein